MHGGHKYQFQQIREMIEGDFEPSRERSLALTNLEQSEMWLEKCKEPVKQAEFEPVFPDVIP